MTSNIEHLPKTEQSTIFRSLRYYWTNSFHTFSNIEGFIRPGYSHIFYAIIDLGLDPSQ